MSMTVMGIDFASIRKVFPIPEICISVISKFYNILYLFDYESYIHRPDSTLEYKLDTKPEILNSDMMPLR